MKCSQQLAVALTGATVVLAAAVAEAQLPSAEERAFDAVDRAITAAVENTDDREAMVHAAALVLDTTEAASAVVDSRVRAHINYLAARNTIFGLLRDGGCFNAWYFHRRFELIEVALNEMTSWAAALGATVNLDEAVVRLQRSVSELGQVLEAWGEPKVVDDQFGQPCGTTPSDGPDNASTAQLREQFAFIIQRTNLGPIASFNSTESRLREADAAANRIVLDVVGRAARSILTTAERAASEYGPDGNTVSVDRAATAVDSAVATAAAPDVSEDVVRTKAALDGLIEAMQETITLLRSTSEFHIADGVSNNASPPASEPEPANDSAAWRRQVADAVNIAEQAAEQAAAGTPDSGDLFSRVSACLESRQRVQGAMHRVEDLTTGSSRPQPIEAETGRQVWEEFHERLEAAAQQSTAACTAIMATANTPGGRQ